MQESSGKTHLLIDAAFVCFYSSWERQEMVVSVNKGALK